MGFKRPYDDEKFHELPLKHSRHLGYTHKSIECEEVSPCHTVFHKPIPTENEENHYMYQSGESPGHEMFDQVSNFVYTGDDMDSTFTRVIEGSDGRDAAHSPHSVNYFDLDIPSRVETSYSFVLNQPPRKQVPIGQGHQAEIPEWEGNENENLETSGMCAVDEKLSGACVIPMPALNMLGCMDVIVGKGRKFCVCEDRGSVRCVRQHIKEAREDLFEMFGCEIFKELGFCDMGEEVTQKWSDEDAKLFHEVVYSNPVTLGLNFWKHLEAAFPSRSKKEIVSYYFNVFILRRRATQNRTYLLDIDSDDDEWHGCYRGSFGTQYTEEEEEEDDEEEEDSVIESPLHQGNEKMYTLHHEEAVSNSSNDEEHKKNSTVEYVYRTSESNGERLNLEDDLCMSFEFGEHEKKLKECNDPMNTKHMQPRKSMMEEIFGYGTCGNK